MATSLAVVRLDQPCQVPWDQMSGDDRVRFCTQCNLSVHNLSAMSEAEAASFLAMRGGGRVCVAYQRRDDGTAVFAAESSGRPLPVVSYESLRAPRRRWLVPAALAGAVAAAGAAAALRPGVAQVATGGTGPTMVPGGIGPPPAVPFNPRNPSPTCGSTLPVADALRYDQFAIALNQNLPAGLEIVDVRHSVYPVGGTREWGQAYVVAASAESAADTPAQAEPRAVLWLMRTGAAFPTNAEGSAPVAHATTWHGGRDLFVESEDAALSDQLGRALAGPVEPAVTPAAAIE